MASLKGFLTPTFSVLEIRESMSMLPQSMYEIELELTGNTDVIQKLVKETNQQCTILRKAVETTDTVEGAPNARYKEYTTFQSVVRTGHYPTYVAMRVELQETLRAKNWTPTHRQQADGFKPQWLTQVWERRG